MLRDGIHTLKIETTVKGSNTWIDYLDISGTPFSSVFSDRPSVERSTTSSTSTSRSSPPLSSSTQSTTLPLSASPISSTINYATQTWTTTETATKTTTTIPSSGNVTAVEKHLPLSPRGIAGVSIEAIVVLAQLVALLYVLYQLRLRQKADYARLRGLNRKCLSIVSDITDYLGEQVDNL
ncbi:hypothetical protein PM082_023058 [Marasmius tenuissimus]|nr:hypothetical protein PM082_023058 [Marasmius tenuissimus]